MALSQQQNLDLKLKQQLTLTPQLQQAIKILNMNSQELSLEVSTMLSQNFMLNFEDDGLREERSDGGEAEAQEGLLEEMGSELPYDSDWDEHYDHDWEDHSPTRDSAPNLEEFISSDYTLSGYLVEQLAQMPIDGALRQCAEFLVYHLDDDGYLRESPTELSKFYELDPELIEAGIDVIRNCQPTGVGAADLKDCLNLQIAQLPPDTPYLDTLKRIMKRHFPFIGKNPPLICQRLRISDEEYRHAAALLASLDPQPGQRYQNNGADNQVRPEIIVREKHGISYIEADAALTPTLSINETYAALIKHANEQEKTLLQAQLNEARWFLSAIDKRADTIRRVAAIIVALQQEFFQEGEKAMKPLTRQKVADMLGIHESTVSRAVNGKYLSCKRGVYELRYFFANQLENGDGEDQSTVAVKALIAEIIAGENPLKPLSDQVLSELLQKEHGYTIARRTIAKYREELGIPTSSARRKR